MKSRLRTCSHGTACNFIHCFRNPGGDYEWADWDNPPPKYWIRKMAVLFGHSDESSYGKQRELEDFESPRDSSRKGTPLHGRRYHSKISCDLMKVCDRKSDRRSRHSRRDHSERKGTSFQDKSEQSEENHESKVLDFDIKNYPHSHDSSEDRSKRRHSEKHQKHEAHQKHKKSQRTKEELSTWQAREYFLNKQEKSERKHRLKSSNIQGEEQKVSEHLSGYADNRSKRSTSRSSEEFYFSRHGIDGQDRYDSGYCSNDSDFGEDFSNKNGSGRNNQVIEKIDWSKTRNHNMKLEFCDDRSTSGEFPDRWDTTMNASDREETHDYSCNGSKLSHRKARSDGKNKHHRRKRKHEINSSCSDEELDRRKPKKYSRSRTPTRWMTSSEKTIQGGSND